MNRLNLFAQDDDVVQYIRANKSCIFHKDDNDNNILQMVIANSPNSINTIAYLLILQPSLTKHKNCKGHSALHIAVKMKERYIVERILYVDPDAMFELEYVSPFHTPFHMAVQNGEFHMVKYMATLRPAILDQLGPLNVSALHLTTNFIVAEYLLTCKPSLIDALDMFGNTPLHYLLLKGLIVSFNMVELLLQKKPALLSIQNDNGDFVLDIAHRSGYRHIVETCIRSDPSVQCHDKHGNTVLHLLALNMITDTNLIAHVTKVRQSELFIRNDNNQTPLDVAIIVVNVYASRQFRLHGALNDTIASYHTHSPFTNIDTWAQEQCSMLNNFLLPDLVRLTVSYLVFPAK